MLVRNAIAPGIVHRQAGLQGKLADILAAQTIGILAGKVLLKDLNILARIGLAMVVVGNNTLRLELVDHGILLVELPVERGLVLIMIPPSVEPNAIDTTIVGEQLAELVVHEGVVATPVLLVRGTTEFLARAAERIVETMPVEVAVVEVEAQAAIVAGIGQLLQNVALEGSAIDDIVRVLGGVPHGETVVVARSEGDILRTRLTERAHPLVGIEARRIKTVGQMGILLVVDTLVVHHPLAVAEHGVDTPVDENTKLEVLEFFLALLDLLRGLILCHRRHTHEQCQNRKDSLLHRVDCFDSF
ncbi:hypothetical protein EVA_09209 [gut metagenome]|uniref:Uncharacterized protein n=1 Tax=gut metagenome TaxID=749906 RepID=J9GRE0_9ZZZZ